MTNTQMILCSPLSYWKTIAIPSRQSANIFSFVHMKLPPPVKQTSCSKKKQNNNYVSAQKSYKTVPWVMQNFQA